MVLICISQVSTSLITTEYRQEPTGLRSQSLTALTRLFPRATESHGVDWGSISAHKIDFLILLQYSVLKLTNMCFGFTLASKSKASQMTAAAASRHLAMPHCQPVLALSSVDSRTRKMQLGKEQMAGPQVNRFVNLNFVDHRTFKIHLVALQLVCIVV